MLCISITDLHLTSEKKIQAGKKCFLLMKFMEFMMIRVRLTLLPLPPPWVENEFLNYIVADKTLDFIVNLLSRGHRTLRNKS